MNKGGLCCCGPVPAHGLTAVRGSLCTEGDIPEEAGKKLWPQTSVPALGGKGNQRVT